ncbi:trihelix transcription factor PTL [Prunus yedoensis var. nudiflora]|uniref:Trihelix transcription factor PTL n=1 Tax=Prunus yedoensis var. nudiflora TaxID=2094558 RepID=A0A314XVA6_PRUYE|nr:trihelix transcription factor PTL [Prunus yedoensis var. nudiflora]
MEMEDQYNMSDLRQLMNGGGSRAHFPSIPLQAATELFPSHRVPPLTAPPAHHHQQHHHYEQLMMMGRPQPHDHHIINPRGLHHHEFRSPDSAAGGGAAANSATVTASLSGGGGLMEAEAGGDIGGSGRWPRQETLTLLEIRSRLDFKFKEANQKGPLWDEVSRIMCEEHGYQRSGKKCREKFENLYKYYKKTKEGKAGRQDGKNYRFFRQLEALYGETTNSVVSTSLPEAHFIGNNSNNNNLRYQTTINAQANQEINTPYHHATDQKHCDSLSLSNSSEFDTSSSEDQDNNDVSVAAMDDDSPDIKTMRKRRGGRGWKVKIKEFIDAQMRKLMDKQEEWLERLMRTLEQKERERMVREEEWRKQEVERVEKEHKFWAKERAWIEARDKALMEALHKLTGGSSSTDQAKANYSSPSPDHDHDQHHHHHHHQHHQTSSDHDQIVHNTSSARELLNKKRKENVNSKSSACYFQNNESCSSLYSSQGGYCAEMNDHEQGGNNDGSNNSPCGNANVGSAVQDNCFPFLMSEGENLWENYGLKLSKGSQNQ